MIMPNKIVDVQSAKAAMINKGKMKKMSMIIMQLIKVMTITYQSYPNKLHVL